jgi:hypothetical protein
MAETKESKDKCEIFWIREVEELNRKHAMEKAITNRVNALAMQKINDRIDAKRIAEMQQAT